MVEKSMNDLANSLSNVQVVGIEMNESAVSDAERNALINGVSNCRFVCGKVRLMPLYS